MKKLIAILAIGSMFIFVSIQCALTKSNYPIQSSQIKIEQPEKVDFSFSRAIPNQFVDDGIISNEEISD